MENDIIEVLDNSGWQNSIMNMKIIRVLLLPLVAGFVIYQGLTGYKVFGGDLLLFVLIVALLCYGFYLSGILTARTAGNGSGKWVIKRTEIVYVSWNNKIQRFPYNQMNSLDVGLEFVSFEFESNFLVIYFSDYSISELTLKYLRERSSEIVV